MLVVTPAPTNLFYKRLIPFRILFITTILYHRDCIVAVEAGVSARRMVLYWEIKKNYSY